jgi:hypothetical protein
VIQHFARCQRTPRRRAKVARMLSPETRLICEPFLEAYLGGHLKRPERLVSVPNSLGERCSISLTASALFSSKAAWVLLGREEPATRAFKPCSLKWWMASRTAFAARSSSFWLFAGHVLPSKWPKASGTAQDKSVFGAQSSFQGVRVSPLRAYVRKLEVSWLLL